ncbi:MAG: hypothetical protein ACSHXI_06905 [Hoeflea sp.]|uniref:hypothetical protein n=1 Tax=Hoeflea sp. TaxID=1940281 RepID=UPI003EF34A7B
MIRLIVTVFAVALLTGCVASDPKEISAVAVPAGSFAPLNCTQLAEEDARVTEELGYMSFRQSNRRTTDVVGIVAIGLSPSGMGSTDWEAQIAQNKGIKAAVNATMVSKECTQPPAVIGRSKEDLTRWHRRVREEQGK